MISSSRSRKGVPFLLRLRLAKLVYELAMQCQKHSLASLMTTRVATNFLQVIYSLKNQYSYDVTRNYLNCYYYSGRNTSPHPINARCWYQLMIKITISIACTVIV